MADDQSMAHGESKPSVIEWAVTAWRDAFSAIQQMPVVFGIGALAIVAFNVLSDPFIPKIDEPTSFGADVLGGVFGLANGFLLTPIAIAVHRFVLLGERTASYRLEPSNPRFRRFFFFTVVIQLFIGVPYLLINLAQNKSGWIDHAYTLGLFVLVVAGLLLMLRTLLLFPAIAVDAPGAGWSNALHDTRRHWWRMMFMAILAGIPIIAVYALMIYWLEWPGRPRVGGPIISAVRDSVWFVLMTAIYAALASRMFAAFADRLARAPAEPSASSPA